MSTRRASLPGASELFRTTAAPSSGEARTTSPLVPEPVQTPAPDRPATGRRRHEEKITVYCSAEELVAIERARLALRADFGVGIDRGRLVREAVALVLADLEANGARSDLVRRLQAE